METKSKRNDWDPPAVTSRMGWRYHHLGIPTNIKRKGERYIPHLKIYVAGFDSSPFGIEWMRFEADCNISHLVRTVPHIAFEVDNLDEAIKGFKVLTPPNFPSDGVRVAMILDNDAPVELLEFTRKSRP